MGTLFVLVATLGGSVAALFNPFLGAFVYIGLALLRPEALWGAGVTGASLVAGMAMLAGWALHGFGDWRFGRAWPAVLGLIGYWVWLMVCAAFSEHQLEAWALVFLLSKVILAVLVAVTTMKTTKQMKALIWMVVIVEGYVSWVMNLSYMQGYNRAEDDGFGQMGRAVFATSLAAALWPAVALTLSSRKKWQQALAGACALLIFHTVLLTFSRGGMLGVMVAAVPAVLLLRKRPMHYAAIVVALLVAVKLTGPEVITRFSSTFAAADERDPSAESRVVLWGNALSLAAESPLVGVGPEGFGFEAPRFGWPLGKEAHSLWVQTIAELGIPGFTFLALFYLGSLPPLLQLARSVPQNEDEEFHASMAWSSIASLIAFVVAAQFVSVARMETSYYLAAFGITIVALRSAPALKRATRPQSTFRPTVPAGSMPGVR